MFKQAVSRRSFLAHTSGSVAAVLGTNALVARGAPGANERLSIGIIGTGDRCSGHLQSIQKLSSKHNVEITALCDVWQVNLKKAADKVKAGFGKEPRQFTRFGELLALDDVDAVVIATPDFGHTPIMIEALKAGKDVYCEKPMSLEVEAASQALDLARQKQRIVQVGTQHRSNGANQAAAKEIATGVLGHISRISSSVNVNAPRWRRGFDDCKEQDVDWEAFLFNRPKRPFDPKLLRQWHLYREFTNGLSGLWMSHYVDLVHMLTGAKYPSSAVANGGTYVWKDGREHCDTFHAVLTYPQGFVFEWGMYLANAYNAHLRIHGTQGTMESSTGWISPPHYKLSAAGGAKDSKIEPKDIKPLPGSDHMENWLECLRSRERPIADIEYGHQHAVGTIMAAAALHTGRRQTYDPQTRRIQSS